MNDKKMYEPEYPLQGILNETNAEYNSTKHQEKPYNKGSKSNIRKHYKIEIDEMKAAIAEINQGLGKTASAAQGGGTMDDGTKMMLERLERDSREREERYHNDSKERESRYHDEAKEREERITKLVEGLRTDIKAEFKTFSSQLDKMETKVDNTYKHISAITISTIVGIAACVIAVVGVLIAAFTLLP